MPTYIARRILFSIPILFGITLLLFAFVALAPGDPVDAYLRPEMAGNQELRQLMSHQLGLDQPLPIRYLAWLGQTLQGNLGYAAVYGPGRWQFDVALSRNFRFKESQKVEFRAEAFNLTNSFRKDNPTTDFNSATFGQVTTALDPRIMQFALKYFF